MDFAIKLIALFLAIVLHEVAHGYVAWKLGDPTARRAHRLTLNPLAHVDPLGTIILPFMLIVLKSPVLFGWAKPVPFNPAYFRDPRRGIMLVGAAGPMTNISVAIISAMFYRLIGPAWGVFSLFLVYLCITNIFLGVFNLIPIPPLDGSRVLIGILPESMAQQYLRLERFGFLIIFGLLYLGAINRIIMPAAQYLIGLLMGA